MEDGDRASSSDWPVRQWKTVERPPRFPGSRRWCSGQRDATEPTPGRDGTSIATVVTGWSPSDRRRSLRSGCGRFDREPPPPGRRRRGRSTLRRVARVGRCEHCLLGMEPTRRVDVNSGSPTGERAESRHPLTPKRTATPRVESGPSFQNEAREHNVPIAYWFRRSAHG